MDGPLVAGFTGQRSRQPIAAGASAHVPLSHRCPGAVAYIKFRRASAAACAIETMHEAVLNEGRGPLLKVMLAEAPNTRSGQKEHLAKQPSSISVSMCHTAGKSFLNFPLKAILDRAAGEAHTAGSRATRRA